MNRDYKTPAGAAPPDWRGLCEELVDEVNALSAHLEATTPFETVLSGLRAWNRARAALSQPEPEVSIGDEWRPCVKLPITVHVREQRPGETHVSTREGITPVRSDDLIMRGVAGEEYPIGRELFNRTYRLSAALAQPEPEVVGPTYDDLSELCAEHGLDADSWPIEKFDALWEVARAVLARWGRPAPVPAGERQVAPVPVLPEDAQVIEPSERTILVPVPVPVAVRERLPRAEDCDAEGRCWFGAPDRPGAVACWDLEREPSTDDTHWLPAHALPLPSGEVEA